MGGQLAALRVPHQLLGGEPAHALDKGAFYLADVQRRVQRLAGVVQDVGAQQLPFAGQGIHHHLGHGSPIGEVKEGPALHGLAVPAQARGGVEAVRPELHPLHIGLRHQGGEIQRLAVHPHRVVGEHHLPRHAAMQAGGTGGQPLADLAGGVLRGLAVQVCSGGCGSGRGVGHLLGVGGGHPHPAEANTQFVRHHLRHFGVQPLPHLGATVVHQNGAIGVHMHQRTGLVEMLDVERDAELERRQRQPALEHRACGIELRNGLASRLVAAGHFQLRHQRMHDVVVDDLAVRCDVMGVGAVEVGAPHFQRVAPQVAGDGVEDVLDGDGALRAAKAAEGGVALGVGLAAVAVHGYIGQPVGVVEVAQRPRHHRARQIGRVPGPRHHRDLGAQHPSLVIKAHFVFVPEAVAPPGDQEVVIAVQPQLDGPPQPRGRYRGHTGEQGRLRLLAAKPTAHPAALHLHVV